MGVENVSYFVNFIQYIKKWTMASSLFYGSLPWVRKFRSRNTGWRAGSSRTIPATIQNKTFPPLSLNAYRTAPNDLLTILSVFVVLKIRVLMLWTCFEIISNSICKILGLRHPNWKQKEKPEKFSFAIIPMKEINQEDVTKRGAMPEWIN
jgi:hypothetical protein